MILVDAATQAVCVQISLNSVPNRLQAHLSGLQQVNNTMTASQLAVSQASTPTTVRKKHYVIEAELFSHRL
jgi:hypothetical protein